MGNLEGALEEWRRLYEAAIAFKRLKSWEWMSNDDYFAITNPETGEIGYCVVMGSGGIEFGLNVYLGPKAASYLKEIVDFPAGQLGDDNEELLFSAKVVSLTFEDRQSLDKKDLSIIRELGYKFRGAGEWPMFRSYEPGLSTWTLNGPQVRFLTVALEQAIQVAERFRQNHNLYFEHDEADDETGAKRLHRVRQVGENGTSWHDEWLPWHVEGTFIEPYTYPDELRLKQLKKRLKPLQDIWESDFDYAPLPIGERGERAVFPRLCLWVSEETSMIMDVKLTEESDCREQYVAQLLELLEQTGRKPARIAVGSKKAYLALKNSADKIGIPVSVNPHLPALLEAKEAITGSL